LQNHRCFIISLNRQPLETPGAANSQRFDMYPTPDRLYSESHRDEAESVLRVILDPALFDHFQTLEADNLAGSGSEADLQALLIDTRARLNCLLTFIAYLIPFAGRRGISRSFLSQISKQIDPEAIAIEKSSALMP